MALRKDVVRFEMIMPRDSYADLMRLADQAGQSRADFIRRALEKFGVKGITRMPRHNKPHRRNGNGHQR